MSIDGMLVDTGIKGDVLCIRLNQRMDVTFRGNNRF